jgi:AcrR family transcriptional regulator
VVQVKKEEIRNCILRSAAELFSQNGYNATTLSAIAKKAKVGVGNIYSYFPSKLDLLYEIYRPWFEEWMADLEKDIAALRSPRQKLKRLVIGLWHDFPAGNPRLANSLMEALSSNDAQAGKPSDLLIWAETRLTSILATILPPKKAQLLENRALAHVLMMAQDGFIINYRWGQISSVDALADKISAALLDGR